MSELTGYLYDNTGTAISSATVQLLTKNTSTQIASTTTNSDGKWAFSGQAAAAYDVKITFGSSVRYIKADQEVQALSLIHICRCRRHLTCRSRWSPSH